MNAVNRFAKRKTLDLVRVSPPPSTGGIGAAGDDGAPEPDLLASAVELILQQRAEDRLTKRLDESKIILLRSVAVPFGLGHIVAAYDRTGGDVHTVHNVRNRVYASDDKAKEYEQRGPYDKQVKDACHSTPSYISTNATYSEQRKAGTLEDSYTGEALSAKPGSFHLDHVISAKTVHDDPGRVLAGLSADELSTRPENLAPTHYSINTSKGTMTPQQYQDWLDLREADRNARIAALDAKESLTQAEINEREKLRAQEGVDRDRLRERGEQAQKTMDDEINRKWYTSREFASEVLTEATKTAAKAGVMAAFGEFLIEFLAAIYDEAHDWYLRGPLGDSAFEDLKVRLHRVADRVIARKEAALKAFVSGSISGFIASFILTLINVFKTTQKRVARLLREGVSALLHALKMVVLPADGISTRESLYGVTHIVVSSTLIVGGIALEEVIEKAILTHLPAIAFVAEPVAVTVSGVVAGLAVVLTAAMIDRWDPYGVVEEQDLRHAIDELDSQIDHALHEADQLLISPA